MQVKSTGFTEGKLLDGEKLGALFEEQWHTGVNNRLEYNDGHPRESHQDPKSCIEIPNEKTLEWTRFIVYEQYYKTSP